MFNNKTTLIMLIIFFMMQVFINSSMMSRIDTIEYEQKMIIENQERIGYE